ncbi:4-hydroxyphenylacetate decarboxylase activase [Tepidibacter thalassicus]|uniref:4-hydroxyphenylacetate decarboxylase subunit A n=1 Tax=Tepidibacter thalassicus DSM 15285 TaxID=1123350 RepID=A0A1M5QV82_9FIRM|nr:4-hydroxyphenylacetate decarboxylase activase [Tepidibacter thalassicus]SHH17609.1 4-hydroxyphenylacetate decarboxylase subunit A [Tepidibacter thalassicus DSM 15285]
MDNEIKGIIFDIQSFSVHDGPGCRTTIFMNGCPLRCEWCANPESWVLKKHIMFSQTNCRFEKGCKLCEDVCEYGGLNLKNNELELNWDICKSCETFECSSVCYYNALKVCGKEYKVSDLIKILNRDSHSWSREGGVTFSGGEPFFQSEFLINTLKECKKNYFHTAIETTAYVNNVTFLEVFKYIDFAFIDLKHMDREKHKQKTGVYNDLILNNIELLANSNWNGRLVLRMPVIRDFNDTYENIMNIIWFMKENNLVEINILPFHRLGESKWRQLGKEYKYKNEGPTSSKKLYEIQNLFLENNIACYIGHDTLF